jgi:4'-phosphopantetheinyl transferase
VLSVSAIHVWGVSLDVPESAVDEAQGTLSREERRQAERFRTGELRRRFIVRRAGLRELLAKYLGDSPRAICLDRGAFGKPALAAPWSDSRLQFSTSHSADLGLVAVAIDITLGIDIERIRPLRDFEGLVRRFFAAPETDALRRLPESERLGAFFHAWSRKEALLKALGTGLSLGLDRVIVSLSADDARVIAIEGTPQPARQWHLDDLRPAPGFAAALARPVSPCRLECFRWQK